MKYSECCGSPIKFHDICSGCGEHCDEVVNTNVQPSYHNQILDHILGIILALNHT
jgi:predicted nucleic acid-binding Zn ribbon protein